MSATGPSGPRPNQFQYPQAIAPLVGEVQRLTLFYTSATDPTLKASYKAVVLDRIAGVQAAAVAYQAQLVAQISSLEPV